MSDKVTLDVTDHVVIGQTFPVLKREMFVSVTFKNTAGWRLYGRVYARETERIYSIHVGHGILITATDMSIDPVDDPDFFFKQVLKKTRTDLLTKINYLKSLKVRATSHPMQWNKTKLKEHTFGSNDFVLATFKNYLSNDDRFYDMAAYYLIICGLFSFKDQSEPVSPDQLKAKYTGRMRRVIIMNLIRNQIRKMKIMVTQLPTYRGEAPWNAEDPFKATLDLMRLKGLFDMPI